MAAEVGRNSVDGLTADSVNLDGLSEREYDTVGASFKFERQFSKVDHIAALKKPLD